MIELDVTINKSEIIDVKLSMISEGADEAVKLVDFELLNEMDKKWHKLRKNYSGDILKSQQLIDRTLAVARKIDNAKRQMVELRKQQRREEFDMGV